MIAFAFRSRAALTAALLVVIATGAPAQPPVPAKPAPLATDSAVLAEAVKQLTGLQLYQTYLNIGLLADARAEGLYEAPELAQLLGSVVVPLGKIEKQLEKITAFKLSKEDAAAITRLKKVAGLLHEQGESLQAFWDTDMAEHGTKYEAARLAAWVELSDMLELDPKKGAAPAEPKKKP